MKCRVPACASSGGHVSTMLARRACLLVLGFTLSSSRLSGQQPDSAAGADGDKETIQLLLQKIEQLEARDKQLEARVSQLEEVKHGTAMAAPGKSSVQAGTPSASDTEPPPNEPAESETMEPEQTHLKIRGFGDFNFHGDNQKGHTTTFSLGELNLFVTSDISDKFKFLSEILFEAESPSNQFKTEPERVLLRYSYNDYFNISVGRYHPAIGYYNTAYHHSTWLQTTTGRPYLFLFEDEGGVLPMHDVGASAFGQIPSGTLGLNYVVEVGNGRASSSPAAEPVQNETDENNHKAFNMNLFVRPDQVPGLRAGFSVYRDVLFPLSFPRTGETIVDTYAVMERSRFEWLNEVLLIRHAPQGLRAFDTPGFYSQISERFGLYRPYLRYQYVNAADHEPIFDRVYGTTVGLRQGPSVGVRYDASESVAVKLQYDYTALRRQPAVDALALQVGFTF